MEAASIRGDQRVGGNRELRRLGQVQSRQLRRFDPERAAL
jgi:hypothetical protein